MNCLSLPMAYLTAEPFEIPHASFRRHFHVAEDLAESRFITYLNFYLRFSSTAITKHGFKFFSRNFVPVFHSAANFSKIFFRDRCKVGCFHFLCRNYFSTGGNSVPGGISDHNPDNKELAHPHSRWTSKC